ncbi:hypothetical protein [Pseudomonas sp. M30-35]|uniref:hypothetical protein n=1 Tax=Pseudomonas sp. M30-35 TaxID=1981174 RepID=UPI000B3D415A|nr:hypothetical protein [Pseudomonas sp. M30-35]ARU87093.1 hypothetical protein B9K09_03435 [Pseudomonas sp. M30-35]
MSTIHRIHSDRSTEANQHFMPVCTVLTAQLADSLGKVNSMTRRLRTAGIRVETASPLDLTIFIAADNAQQLADYFRSEWRGVSWTTCGKHTKNMVRLGGVTVAWMTPVKEQDQ